MRLVRSHRFMYVQVPQVVKKPIFYSGRDFAPPVPALQSINLRGVGRKIAGEDRGKKLLSTSASFLSIIMSLPVLLIAGVHFLWPSLAKCSPHHSAVAGPCRRLETITYFCNRHKQSGIGPLNSALVMSNAGINAVQHRELKLQLQVHMHWNMYFSVVVSQTSSMSWPGEKTANEYCTWSFI